MAIILNMIGFDNTTRMNCQVSPVYHVWFCLLNCDPQGLGHYQRRKHLVLCDQGATPNTPLSFYPVLCLRCLRFLFIVDCAPYVRIPYVTIVVWNPDSRKPGRIAIWNRETIIVLIATGLWLADVAFLIYGEYILQIKGGSLFS